MRIIAGQYRSRPLRSPAGTATRPTSDRLRETLFNILAPRIEGARFIDLYAGTGAVGLEAISRGAAHVWFAENSPAALKILRANLASLKVTTGHTLDDRGTAALLDRLTVPVDLVYLDPPYEAEPEYTQTLGFLGSAAAVRLLTPAALVIAEHAKTHNLADRYGTLTRTRTHRQGDTTLSFYTPALERKGFS